jgi:hypothetical protein
MVQEPEYLKAELKQIGRMQYHRLRRVAAMLRYYRIDIPTIEERLIERGCSPELAAWIVETAGADSDLAKKVEDSETPESTTQVVIKGINGAILLVIVFLIAKYIQMLESIGLLFVLAPALLIASFIGSMMAIRAVFEIRRRAKERD